MLGCKAKNKKQKQYKQTKPKIQNKTNKKAALTSLTFAARLPTKVERNFCFLFSKPPPYDFLYT